MIDYQSDAAFAKRMDAEDPLRGFRERFYIPPAPNGGEALYFCGNSLGLQPKATEASVLQELEDWKNMGVHGHLGAKNPWLPYHEFLTENLAKIVGAKPVEVVAANSLTVNLHLMMVSFYRPMQERFKILIEGGAFPSDRYAAVSQIKFHGFDPAEALIELAPRTGEKTLRIEDILDVIESEGAQIALILIGGVQYYTGQLFNMAAITKAGHDKGCIVGFDLAHAAGNVELKLHDWDVDFACWCSYKYLNAGPGSVAGLFVHERHAQNNDLPRFCGWWGHDKESRFKMGPEFHAIAGAEGWQLSNPPILSLAAVKASLEVFAEAGMERLVEKSRKLTGYLAFLLNALESDAFVMMTPDDPAQRGCQISITVTGGGGKEIFAGLEAAGIVCDWREPDCIRLAPVPLYNSYQDIYDFVRIFAEQLGLNGKLQEAAG
jgi:kynureninase